MSTLTSRLSLYKPASGETVNLTTDLNNNLDSIDTFMNFASCTSSTRPSVKWDGLSIHETDTNKCFVWNSSPATSGWFELYTPSTSLGSFNITSATTGTEGFTLNVTGDSNKRYQVRADGRVEWGSGSGATDTFLRRTGSNALTTDGTLTVTGTTTVSSTTDSTALSVSGGGTFTKSLTVGGAASLAGAQGVLNLRNATTAPTGLPTTGVILSSEAGQLKNYVTSGAVNYIGGPMAMSATVTVANTVTETDLGTVTIPANDAIVGAVYRVKAWGQAGTTGTPTFNFRFMLGANQLAQTSAWTTASGISNRAWWVEGMLVCLATGGTGTWFGNMNVQESMSTAAKLGQARLDGGATVANATTSSNTCRITATWGTASASNTITCRGYIVERVC